MSEDKTQEKEVEDVAVDKQDKVSASRKQFQDLIESAKELDFTSDVLYVACPELGDNMSIKLTTMSMVDIRKMQEFESVHKDVAHWEAHFMFCAKDEEGNYLFEGADDLKFIQSKGNVWFLRYGVPTLELNGFMEHYAAEKK